jgi:hypothetical protein
MRMGQADEADTNPVRRPCKFTETDLRRALRAATKEHITARVDVMPDGRISIVPIAGAAAIATTVPCDVNEWDGPL